MKNSKFWPLANYLLTQDRSRIVLTFEEVETILGESLCKSARKYIAYWQPSATHTLPNLCLEAGYKVANVDLRNEKVCFEKELQKQLQS